MPDAVRIEACGERAQMKACNRFVRDNGHAGAAQQRFQMCACVRNEVRSDQNVIAAVGKFDADGLDR